MSDQDVGDLLGILVTATFFGWLFWAFARRRRAVDIVADEPAGTPYRVFTRKYDVTARARDVPALLRANLFLRSKGWTLVKPRIWRAQVAVARALAAPGDELTARLAAALAAVEPADWAICLLIDQSGSMKGQSILHAAAAVRWCSDTLTRAGVKVATLGFSTVGWQGGEARTNWLASGAPARPGRLAALLHVIYQSFGEALHDEDWEVMLHPDLLRENIDGEAIEWAAAMLRDRQEPNRLLIVLSDGTPVDDATLAHNGPSFLWRHLRQVTATIGADPTMMIAAVGLEYRVDQVYPLARHVGSPGELPAALSDLIAECFRSAAQ